MNEEIETTLRETPEVAEQVIASLRQFIDRDRYLLEVNANERSLTHRIGMYLQAQFERYDVDCEFNRDGHDPKELYIGTEDTTVFDDNAMTVYPDIIVHRRGSNNDNLLVIEFKKSSSSVGSGKDMLKLRAYKTDLHYRYALFVELGTTRMRAEPEVTQVRWV
ncbi:TPA: hypothetical protein NJ344_004824 [Vibrio parahaemolyticus]|uniref:hypothetical protein n=1 Tax=Vibrio parahaemolyticus TaxID=670 RepID=UPI0006A60228|nr:hypothetical protein [Vibrio parahaemolyticus]EHR7861429.1 hypothetical protein [Vibrio parahaemolyticus]EJC6932673.1 hypothetical protein [Vibrio parahaemolyticus]ELA9426099.1 hypothetical protein [Vibrio parahaemolyticus]KOE91131.1 hypothetical protein ACS91_07745 [Vibrio parahaemolyticus]HCG5908579.1 hypothetical protein [Vibrio parahaemolyticus]